MLNAIIDIVTFNLNKFIEFDKVLEAQDFKTKLPTYNITYDIKGTFNKRPSIILKFSNNNVTMLFKINICNKTKTTIKYQYMWLHKLPRFEFSSTNEYKYIADFFSNKKKITFDLIIDVLNIISNIDNKNYDLIYKKLFTFEKEYNMKKDFE